VEGSPNVQANKLQQQNPKKEETFFLENTNRRG
jgi:hypothetical protein